MIAAANIYRSCDRLDAEAFMIDKLVPQLWKGACVVLDNSTIHKGEEIKTAVEAVGAKLVFLSPYSSEFNPIENLRTRVAKRLRHRELSVWSKLKNILRRIGARTYQDLEEAIAIAYAQISLDNIRNWFAHCCYSTSPN